MRHRHGFFFTYDRGMANVKLKDLDPVWQRHFHYVPAKAGDVEMRPVAADRLSTPPVLNRTENPSSFASVPAGAGESGQLQEYLRRNYNLQLTLQNEDGVSGNLRLGAMTNNIGQVADYLRALANECKKYPLNFFSDVGVSEIVLCGDLRMGRAPIAGVFMGPQRKLYIKYHWSRLGARDREAFHAFHHELGHAVQTAAWGDGHYDWREWADLNPHGFNYGKGGDRELMADPDKNWGTWSTNQPGFLNAYSTTAPWEDRSEIMAALMNDGDRRSLGAWCRRDPVIQKKVELMAGLLAKVCGNNQSKNFWEQAVASLETQPEPEVSLASNPPGPAVTVDLQKAIGGDLIDAGGNAVSFETLKGKKYLLLYFSASWCPHCREFMPQFLEFYQNTRYRDKFEVLFVSSDHSEREMLSYLREMPWKAVRLNSTAESFLKANYARDPGIPALVLIDSDGRLLCIRKGFAKGYEYGVDKVLEILNQKLAG